MTGCDITGCRAAFGGALQQSTSVTTLSSITITACAVRSFLQPHIEHLSPHTDSTELSLAIAA
jgi:hypothetical protein